MRLDDSIVCKYLAGESPDSYRDCWIYSAAETGSFLQPDPDDREWVSRLHDKLTRQIAGFEPRNATIVRQLFPDFDAIAGEYKLMLVVGFPDPYDAMVLEHDGKETMVFDLIQFGREALDEGYSCHRVLTHELIHMCLHNRYPSASNLSYVEKLSYIAFDEGFAHALSYPDNIDSFQLDDFHLQKYEAARSALRTALQETDEEGRKACLLTADTGAYWDKFASISGKLYLLAHVRQIDRIYEEGWHRFADRILA